MSDKDNYWSDEDENEEELVQDSRELPPLEYDSEEEEEYYDILKLVSNKVNDDSLFTYEKKNSKKNSKNNSEKNSKNNSKKNSKNKSKKIIFDFDGKEENNEKKVWRSKRMKEKKGPEFIKRKFNPRLPPPGNKFKNIKLKNDIKINLKDDFPKL
jgi:hypothetical protein